MLLSALVGLTAAEPGYFFQFTLDQAGQNGISTQFWLGDRNATFGAPTNHLNGSLESIDKYVTETGYVGTPDAFSVGPGEFINLVRPMTEDQPALYAYKRILDNPQAGTRNNDNATFGDDTFGNAPTGSAALVASDGQLAIVIKDASTGEPYLNKTLAINAAEFGIGQNEPVYNSKRIMLDKMPRLDSDGHAILDAYLIFTPPSGKAFIGTTEIFWEPFREPPTIRKYTKASG